MKNTTPRTSAAPSGRSGNRDNEPRAVTVGRPIPKRNLALATAVRMTLWREAALAERRAQQTP